MAESATEGELTQEAIFWELYDERKAIAIVGASNFDRFQSPKTGAPSDPYSRALFSFVLETIHCEIRASLEPLPGDLERPAYRSLLKQLSAFKEALAESVVPSRPAIWRLDTLLAEELETPWVESHQMSPLPQVTYPSWSLFDESEMGKLGWLDARNPDAEFVPLSDQDWAAFNLQDKRFPVEWVLDSLERAIRRHARESRVHLDQGRGYGSMVHHLAHLVVRGFTFAHLHLGFSVNDSLPTGRDQSLNWCLDLCDVVGNFLFKQSYATTTIEKAVRSELAYFRKGVCSRDPSTKFDWTARLGEYSASLALDQPFYGGWYDPLHRDRDEQIAAHRQDFLDRFGMAPDMAD